MVPFSYQYQNRILDSSAEMYLENCQARYRVASEKGVFFTILPPGIRESSNKMIWVQSVISGETVYADEIIQAMGAGIEHAIIKLAGWLPRYESKEVVVEIDLRGRFLMMACDIEFTMLHIMMYCAPDPMNQLRRFNSKEMQMHNKIECTIADLKTHKPVLYEEYMDELDKLWEFKDVRNDLAHKKLLFEEGEKFQKFKFLFIQDDDQGNETLFYKLYTIEYFKEVLQKFMDLNLTLAGLVTKLQEEMQHGPYVK